MPGYHTFYDGSKLLAPLVPYVGIDSDKVFIFYIFLSMTYSCQVRLYYFGEKIK